MTDRLPWLPVQDVLEPLADALTAGNAILQAPPGAGKTTVVPLRLMAASWLTDQRILVLEPRRMAARAAARRMASLLGEPVGRTVGYRTRFDTRTSATARIEVVTEGILVRMLQNDPELPGTGLVIFDEFHERSVIADLGLALCLDVQTGLRPDLKLLVMSATLNIAGIRSAMRGAPAVVSEGRSFPVSVHYRRRRPEQTLAMQVVTTVRQALADERGDILVFLPGAGEIRRAATALTTVVGDGVEICPLHGTLPDADQDRAIRPGNPGRRRVVLSTPIAETSLTIEGITVVVDAGLRRAPRFSPATGLTRLTTDRISLASAEQRRGRAGRLAPGVCYRLWSRGEHAALARDYPPAILQADLAPLVLELAVWGTTDASTLTWVDPPPAPAWNQAMDLLRLLGALDGRGQATAHGRAMAAAGFEPRLAHMLLKARELGAVGEAAHIAALLSERDFLRFEPGQNDADIELRLALLTRPQSLPGATVNEGARRRILDAARDAQRRIGAGAKSGGPVSPGVLVALAWPDRIAGQREPGGLGYRLASGRGARLSGHQRLSSCSLLAVASLDGRGADAKIHLAAALDADEIESHFEGLIETRDEIGWEARAGAVLARRMRRLGAVVLREQPLQEADSEAVAVAMLDGVRQAGLTCLPWTAALNQWRARLAFAAGVVAAGVPVHWPDVSDGALIETLDQWLGPWLSGIRRLDHLQRLDLAAILGARLDYATATALNELAPERWQVPSGARLRIDYAVDLAAGETPVLAVRLQEMFGARETPRIAAGQVPLTLHLLSPAGRPVQVTRDLPSFWSSAYHEVRKDLRGRYPKHAWPSDPATAEPARRPRRTRR